MYTTIAIMFLVGIIILIGFAYMLDKLTEAHEREKQIYRDAYRERWNSEKGETL